MAIQENKTYDDILQGCELQVIHYLLFIYIFIQIRSYNDSYKQPFLLSKRKELEGLALNCNCLIPGAVRFVPGNFEFIFYNQIMNINIINCLAENFIIHIAIVRVF